MQPFWYELDASRIAERPVLPYHNAKMLIVDRISGHIQDSTFKDLAEVIDKDFHLVLNNTKVIKARFVGKLESGANVEIMLVEPKEGVSWKILGKPMRKLKPGVKVFFDSGLECQVTAKHDDEYAQVEFISRDNAVSQMLEAVGTMPIPPYIRRGKGDAQDILDYQTCFAENPGSIAAPTASLHLTKEVFVQLAAKGISHSTLTLHLGPASFKAVLDSGESEIRPPGKERLVYESDFIEKIKNIKASQKKILAVGTSSTRALESIAQQTTENNSETDLFITPGFRFSYTDALITNFHQPGTTHLLLVEAFLGRELLEKSYKHALANNYRFLSYGDGMLIV